MRFLSRHIEIAMPPDCQNDSSSLKILERIFELTRYPERLDDFRVFADYRSAMLGVWQ
jgi:hypothetical protein